MQEQREVLERIISGIGLLLDLPVAPLLRIPQEGGKRAILH
jgi:hypothetical protein